MKQEGWTETVSHEAIYQFIYSKRPDLRECLPRHHMRRKHLRQSKKHRTPRIKQRTPISKRPAKVDRRKEVGHWESDLAVSRAGTAALQVTVERKSRYVKLNKLDQRNAKASRKGIVRRLCRIPEGARKTITYDNGAENAQHTQVNQALGTKSYFCDPYSAWQRGTVENTVGLVRRQYPKGAKLADLAPNDLKSLEYQLNSRPRKCLQFQTPMEVFRECCVALQC
jgi:IS30 family transposase